MSKQSSKPVSLAVTAVLVGGLGLSASAFAMSDLAQGYLLGAGEATKAGEGKAGEGKCGMAKMDTDKDGRISRPNSALRTRATPASSPPTTRTRTASSAPRK